MRTCYLLESAVKEIKSAYTSDIANDILENNILKRYIHLADLRDKNHPKVQGKSVQKLVEMAKDIDRGNIPLWLIE